MASTLEDDILRILEETRDEIRANMAREGVNASGRTSASIRVRKEGDALQLVGGYDSTHSVDGYSAPDTAPIPTLEVGRKGGGNPPVPRGFYYIIREWSKVKGISFADESERNTFAFLLSRKIAREGTRRHTDNKDIYSTPVNTAKERIIQAVNASVGNTLRAAIGGVQVSSLRGAFTN